MNNIKRINIKRLITALILISYSFLASGCHIGIVKLDEPNVYYKNAKFIDFDKPNPRIKITKKTKRRISFNFDEDFTISSTKDITKVSYNSFYYDLLNMITIKDQVYNGRKYNFLIDTGFNHYAITNTVFLDENNLSIMPAGRVLNNNIKGGYCFLKDFTFGDTYIDCLPSLFILQHWEVSAFWIPLWQQKGLILGNKLLSRYSYLHFDNPQKELSFSVNKEFIPPADTEWEKYPLILTNENVLRVKLPLGDQKIEIMFDTCGHHGIVLDQNIWEQIKSGVEIIKERESTFLSGFNGKFPCRKIKINNLKLANRNLDKITVIVQDDSNKAFSESLISMKYFRENNIVLDFKNKLFWIGKK